MNVLGELEDGLPAIGDEPIIGWRKWSLYNGDLVSLNGEPWPYRAPLEATHGKDLSPKDVRAYHVDGPAPCPVQNCGIYAAKTMHSLGGAGYAIALANGIPVDEAWGTVKLYGRVVVHALGYRAQYAYPDRLFVGSKLVAELIARNYGCDVAVVEAVAPSIVADADTAAPAAGGNVIVPLRTSKGTTPMISVSLRAPNGQMWTYNGPADPTAIGHWFGQFVPLLWREVVAMGQGCQWNFMLDTRAWEQ